MPEILRKRVLHVLFSWLVLGTIASPLEPEEIGSSPQIQAVFLNPPPRECPVLQDGSTTNTFPWTHPPTCLSLIRPSSPGSHTGKAHTYCVYTNTAFNNGRGISIVTSPETAAELSYEVWESGVGGRGHSKSEEQWEVKETEGKGFGLFAKRDIDPGETLILQTPVLLVSREVLDSVSHSRRRTLLEKAVTQLPPTTRELVMSLSRRGGDSVIEDIINVNAHRAKVWDGTFHLLLNPEAARINHACRPNTYYRFNDHTLLFDLFALRPISPGEEMTYSYGFSTEPHATRQERLKGTWGFTCTCSLCTSPTSTLALSDTNLLTISSIKSSLPTSLDDIPQYITILPKLISLLDEEGLLAEMPLYEEILAYAWSAVRDKEKARAWAERARWHWGVVAGKESWEARRMGELAENVEGHFTWGMWEGEWASLG
ncbi:SET domain-containing protein [Bimuria novae-zelandiae CBS 107.79]|uniref:SET domain-containing protein n=1 Tax=Bimuria novae-zelandiae CBS 107.79 TaxID=1447943 RepID=A0A6A5V332_9PLEO|nr:SET domain-containing protein [Bimuria novae-zelandiae CBS 107.79]